MVISRQSLAIAAVPERIWDIQIDVDAWPEWRPDVTRAVLTGPFAEGSSFHWITSGLDITSTIRRVDPYRLIEWGGPANGITAVHRWTFERHDERTVVSTEETWEGGPIDADPDGMKAALDASLVDWLERLRRRAEAGPEPVAS